MNINEFIAKFAEAIEVEASNLTLDTKFRELEEWSSISIMLLIAMFDSEFNKEISTEDIKQCNTIDDLYKFAIK